MLRVLLALFTHSLIKSHTPLAICFSGITDLGSRPEMWSRTRLFLLASTLALLIGHHVTRSQRPRLGGAVNVFSRYGYLSISMRVVPRNDTETWIFREPTLDVFKNATPLPSKQRQAQAKINTAVFDGDFHMEFCDNIRHVIIFDLLLKDRRESWIQLSRLKVNFQDFYNIYLRSV